VYSAAAVNSGRSDRHPFVAGTRLNNRPEAAWSAPPRQHTIVTRCRRRITNCAFASIRRRQPGWPAPSASSLVKYLCPEAFQPACNGASQQTVLHGHSVTAAQMTAAAAAD